MDEEEEGVMGKNVIRKWGERKRLIGRDIRR